MKLKVYFYTMQCFVERDGSVDPSDIMVSTMPCDGDRVQLGSRVIEMDLPDQAAILANNLATAERRLKNYRAESRAKITDLERKVAELKSLEAPA